MRRSCTANSTHGLYTRSSIAIDMLAAGYASLKMFEGIRACIQVKPSAAMS